MYVKVRITEGRRSQMEIFTDALHLLNISGGSMPVTHLISMNRMGPKVYKNTLKSMEDRGLIKNAKVGRRRTIYITDRGLRALEKLNEFYKEFGRWDDG